MQLAVVNPEIWGADSGSPADPTGTANIRCKFRAAIRRRLDVFRAGLHRAVIDQDLLGLDVKSTLSVHPAAVRCEAFAEYLSSATEVFAGGWGLMFIRESWDSGIAAIGVSVVESRIEQYRVLFEHEMEGIVAALVQWLNRAANDLITRRVSKATAWRVLLGAFKTVTPRFDALVNMLVVKVHNLARIESLREDGVVHYGVKAERIPVQQTLDARKKLRRARPTKYVKWLTAGDDRVCPKCEDLEGRVFSYTEVIGLLPLHINCFPGDTNVSPVGDIAAASKRRFKGDIVVICTAGGKQLRCTANHPILTLSGWVAAAALTVGDKVICPYTSNGGTFEFYNQHVPTAIEDIASSFVERRGVHASAVPICANDFHGDGTDGEIAVIWTDRFLLDKANSSFSQVSSKFVLDGVGMSKLALVGKSTLYSAFQRVLLSTSSLVRGFCEIFAFLRRELFPVFVEIGAGPERFSVFFGKSSSHLFGLGASGYSGFSQVPFDDRIANTETFAEVGAV